MNGRTAKLLRRVAKQTGIKYKALKRAWKTSPAKERGTIRKQLQTRVEENESNS